MRERQTGPPAGSLPSCPENERLSDIPDMISERLDRKFRPIADLRESAVPPYSILQICRLYAAPEFRRNRMKSELSHLFIINYPNISRELASVEWIGLFS